MLCHRLNLRSIDSFAWFRLMKIVIQDHQRSLGCILDQGLAFDRHLDEKINKANRGIGLIRPLREFLPRDSLVTIYKSHVRPHLDYGDIVYDRPAIPLFLKNLSPFNMVLVLQ